MIREEFERTKRIWKTVEIKPKKFQKKLKEKEELNKVLGEQRRKIFGEKKAESNCRNRKKESKRRCLEERMIKIEKNQKIQ